MTNIAVLLTCYNRAETTLACLGKLFKQQLDFEINIDVYLVDDKSNDGTAELVDGVSIGQQARKQFGMVYKTVVGNDVDGTDYGSKIHLIYLDSQAS